MLYLTASDIVAINQRILGGTATILDANLLGSAVLRPQTAAHYTGADSASQAALLIESPAVNHPFIDGNKRTAATAGLIFLRVNGLQLHYQQYGPGITTDELGDQIIRLVTHQTTADQVADWIRRHAVIQP